MLVNVDCAERIVKRLESQLERLADHGEGPALDAAQAAGETLAAVA